MRRMIRNSGDSSRTLDDADPDDWEDRQREADILMRDDITVMLDEAESLVNDVMKDRSRVSVRDIQLAAEWLLRATLVAEAAYAKNCTSTGTPECFRSGEIILEAQGVMRSLVLEARDLGIIQGTRKYEEGLAAEAAAKKKSGWFSGLRRAMSRNPDSRVTILGVPFIIFRGGGRWALQYAAYGGAHIPKEVSDAPRRGWKTYEEAEAAARRIAEHPYSSRYRLREPAPNKSKRTSRGKKRTSRRAR